MDWLGTHKDVLKFEYKRHWGHQALIDRRGNRHHPLREQWDKET